MQLQFSTPEEWRPVVGYEGEYEVSSQGQVKSLHPYQGTRPGRILKPWQQNGYRMITLSHPDRPSRAYVHRLVAFAFLEPPQSKSGFEVNHKDGQKANNCVSNLEWLAITKHRRRAAVQGLTAKGERAGQAKLTSEAIRRIRLFRGKVSQADLAREYGVHQTTVWAAQRCKTWRHV